MNEIVTEKFVGIEVSKDRLEIGIEPGEDSLHLAYDEAGIAETVRRLLELAPTLIVIEATGGKEIRVAGELLANALPVAVVDPRQARDFVIATGLLAMSDGVDAGMLAAFARAIRSAVRPLKQVDILALKDLVTRRHQLGEMRAQESARLGPASQIQQKSLMRHISWLDKCVADIDCDLAKRLRASDAWRTKENLLRSIPGLGVWGASGLMRNSRALPALISRNVNPQWGL